MSVERKLNFRLRLHHSKIFGSALQLHSPGGSSKGKRGRKALLAIL